MVFAKKYKDYTIEDWMKVWWSDEITINHLGSDGKRFVWKRTKESLSNWLVENTVREGGIMVWDCMNWEGIEYISRIEVKMTREVYKSILGNEPMKTLEYYNQEVNNIIFQYDNNLKHTCKRVKKWIENQESEVID